MTTVIKEGGEGLGTISREMFNFVSRSFADIGVSDGSGTRDGAPQPDADRREPLTARPDFLSRLGSWRDTVVDNIESGVMETIVTPEGDFSPLEVFRRIDFHWNQAFPTVWNPADPLAGPTTEVDQGYLGRLIFGAVRSTLALDVLFETSDPVGIDSGGALDPVSVGSGGQ